MYNPPSRKSLRADHASEFGSWCNMRSRCFNPKDKGYPAYGARGITVCARWKHSFANFLEDMGPKPTPRHSIDRYPNNDGNYEPGNCRWATSKQQNRNRRDNVRVVWQGQDRLLIDIASSWGLSYRTVLDRINAGWPSDLAITEPLGSKLVIREPRPGEERDPIVSPLRTPRSTYHRSKRAENLARKLEEFCAREGITRS